MQSLLEGVDLPADKRRLIRYAHAQGAGSLAGMWAYRARDAVATAMPLGMWGSFWIAYGILNILLATHVLTAPTPWYHDTSVGFWFFALAVITGSGAAASLAESLGLFAVLATLATGSALLAAA